MTASSTKFDPLLQVTIEPQLLVSTCSTKIYLNLQVSPQVSVKFIRPACGNHNLRVNFDLRVRVKFCGAKRCQLYNFLRHFIYCELPLIKYFSIWRGRASCDGLQTHSFYKRLLLSFRFSLNSSLPLMIYLTQSRNVQRTL